ncbi:hypothetical protein CRUP_008916 [Coryphaenoides rupestris]|nr:hypothetical protein CRUP_008916 [Coryphaenoides rupestris]
MQKTKTCGKTRVGRGLGVKNAERVLTTSSSVRTKEDGGPVVTRVWSNELKNLALEAETELERQDDVLTTVGSSTERATMSMDKQTCRMKRLL